MKERQEIENVSDTALWVAMYRAMETDRPDAHFRDPYARRLAGERGAAILRTIPDGEASAWPLIVRTCVFDDMILRTIRERGARVVVNLAAGLDARPYRLDLPSDLEWIEVDLPAMIAYKQNNLKDEKPRCRLERIAVDLANLNARRELFDRIQAEGKPGLVVSEGLLTYLTEEEVASLADDLQARTNLRWWMFDFMSPRLKKMLAKRWGPSLKRAQFKFAPADGVDFFLKRGWRLIDEKFPAEEARRLNREMRFAWAWRLMASLTPAKTREEFRRLSSFTLLGRD